MFYIKNPKSYFYIDGSGRVFLYARSHARSVKVSASGHSTIHEYIIQSAVQIQPQTDIIPRAIGSTTIAINGYNTKCHWQYNYSHKRPATNNRRNTHPPDTQGKITPLLVTMIHHKMGVTVILGGRVFNTLIRILTFALKYKNYRIFYTSIIRHTLRSYPIRWVRYQYIMNGKVSWFQLNENVQIIG